MAYTINPERKTIKEKAAEVEATLREAQEYPTLALLELTQLPDSLLQALRKKIGEKGGKVKILRKPVLQRVLSRIPALQLYADKINRPLALIFTSLSPYELHQFFRQNRKKRAAKVGEKAPFELIIPAGDTDIPPGPALSELKTAGIHVQIKAGKIAVAKDSVVAKSGEAITDIKAKALQKLGVLPFETRAYLFVAHDGKYVYEPALLDIGETLPSDLLAAVSQGINFSLNASYPTPQTVSLLLSNALRQAIDFSLNASVYNPTTIPIFLSSALLQAKAIEGLESGEKK